MKVTSDHQPVKAQSLGTGKGYLIAFNVQQVEIEGETKFQFDAVKVNKLDRAEIIQAIIRTRYQSIDDELALINNRTLSAEKEAEYQEYQTFRTFAKTTADEAIQ
jgi:hypothetical protein